jgi:hypothetical protein
MGPEELADGVRWQGDRVASAHGGPPSDKDYDGTLRNEMGSLSIEATVLSKIQYDMEEKMKYGLLWLLGVPIPILILLYFLF